MSIEHGYTWLIGSGLAFAVAVAVGITIRRGAPGRVRRIMAWTTVALASIVALLLAVPGVYLSWAQHRPHPASERRVLVPGVEYERTTRTAPRPMVVHTLSVDLSTPGLSFVVTPREAMPIDGFTLRARKTSAFAREFDCDAAINANYFFPFRSNTPWDYYPKAGEGCEVLGLAQADGDRYGTKPWRGGTVYLAPGGRVSIDVPPTDVSDSLVSIVSGAGLIVRDGRVVDDLARDELALKPYPRAALGLNRDRTRMTWVVIDGKQINYSEGATLAEFADVLLAMGIDHAVRLDEGGSATLVGDGRVLNVPTNTRLIGRERPVANHLGIRVRDAGGRPRLSAAATRAGP